MTEDLSKSKTVPSWGEYKQAKKISKVVKSPHAPFFEYEIKALGPDWIATSAYQTIKIITEDKTENHDAAHKLAKDEPVRVYDMMKKTLMCGCVNPKIIDTKVEKHELDPKTEIALDIFMANLSDPMFVYEKILNFSTGQADKPESEDSVEGRTFPDKEQGSD